MPRREDARTQFGSPLRALTCALGYARVSSEEQVRQGISLEMQRSRMAAACAAQGLDLVEVYADEGLSGAKRDRPALARLLEDLDRHKAGAVVTWKFDRVARNARHLLEIVETLETKRVRFLSVTESFDTGTPVGKLQLTILAACAEFERAQIQERVQANLLHLAASGYWPGKIPYGYRGERRQTPSGQERTFLVPDSKVAKFVRLAYRLVGDEHLPFEMVCRRLTALTGEHWETNRLKPMLRSPVHKGEIPWSGQSFPGPHKPLVNGDLWARTQQMLESRGRTPSRPPKRDWLLSGLLRCPTCGGGMVAHYQTKDSYNVSCYYCGARCAWDGKVGKRMVSARRIETAVLDAIEDLSKGGPRLAALPREDASDSERALLQSRLAGIPKSIINLSVQLADGLIDRSQFREAKKRMEERRLEIEAALAAFPLDGRRPGALRREFANLAELLRDPKTPVQEKRDWLRGIFSRIEWESTSRRADGLHLRLYLKV